MKAVAITETEELARPMAMVLCDLFKARLTTMVLITTAVGFYLGETGLIDSVLLLSTLFGTGLVAAGASALNQYLERDFDALMRRTETRPLPSGRMKPESVLLMGVL